MKSMTFKELQDTEAKLINKNTAKNYFGIMNKVNNHYGWEKDTIQYDLLCEKAQELPEVVKGLWNFPDMAQLKQKLSSISSLMTRCGFGEDHAVKAMVRNLDRTTEVKVRFKEQTIPDWETLKPLLKQKGQDNDVAGIIARIFSYGYVLRVAEIFQTVTIDDGENNYLDLVNCKWVIRKQKNRRTKRFSVSESLCESLKGRIGVKWLLHKSNRQPYKKSSWNLSYHGWCLPDNNTIRKSYETWNIKNNDPEIMKQWHDILGHTKTTAQDYYNFPVQEVKEVQPKKIQRKKIVIKLRDLKAQA